MNYNSLNYYHRKVDLDATLLHNVSVTVPSKCPTGILLEAEFRPGWIQYVSVCTFQTES